MTRSSGKPVKWVALTGAILAGLFAQEAPRKPPAAARKAFQSAERAQAKNQIALARRGYETAVGLYPDYDEAWCELGLLQAEQGEYPGAMRSFRQAIRSNPRAVCPYLPLAILEHGARDWNALVEVTERLLRLDSIDYPLAHLLNAGGHYNLGEYAEAEKAARAAEALDSRRFPKVWEVLGWTAVRSGNDVAAISQFEKYLEAMSLDAGADMVRSAVARLAAKHPEIPRETLTSPTFRVDANLALVQFQIVPRRGRLISPLAPEDIEIREDGIPQKTKLFEAGRGHQTGVPIEISLLFDCSTSITRVGALDPYVFHTSLLDEYENVSVAIYAFSDIVNRITRPTRDARTLKNAMDAVLAIPSPDWRTTTASTRLFGGIRDTVIDAAEGRPGVVRMVVVFSDGISESKGYQDEGVWAAAREAARKNGTALYPVLLVMAGSIYNQPGLDRFIMEHANPSIQNFINLGPDTGGQRFIRIAATDVLPNILKLLAKQTLPYTYVAGYYPDASDKGKRHEAQVVLLNKDQGALSGGGRIVIH